MLAETLAVANGANVKCADLYKLRFETCVVGQSQYSAIYNFENLHIKVGYVLSVLSIFVLDAIVEGTWVKCTIVITTMCVDMKNNQGQQCY